MRYFNTEGLCDPKIHYMVNLDGRLNAIKRRYVERGSYFAINRGRQYGKTTTLRLLEEYLKPDFIVLFMDFQWIGMEEFENAAAFVQAFIRMVTAAFGRAGIKDWEGLMKPLADLDEGHPKKRSLRELFARLSRICADATRPIVLMVDEVDSASNSQVFLDFLAMLRGYYLDRKNSPIFHSVILAGVYDIKNLKLKLRPKEAHKYNSPWNIAARFDVDMSFSKGQVAAMLEEYEADRQTGMDVQEVAREIHQYTSGYPYLVSAVCKILDEKLPESGIFPNKEMAWSRTGIVEAVKTILDEPLPLFQSMMRQLDEQPALRQMLHALLFQGKRVTYNPDSPVIGMAFMLGYIVSEDRSVQVANRIFEMRLYNFFLSEEELTNAIYDKAQGNKSSFFCDGRLDMEQVLEKFVLHFSEIYGDSSEKFVEDYGRKLFLLYLKPIINGMGNYYIEAQTRDARRTDVIVDYLGEQSIIELKIWHGNEYHQRGEAQLAGYLEYYRQQKGYLISFNFNKKKKRGVKKIWVGSKMIVEAVV